jgi:hypothetical protein
METKAFYQIELCNATRISESNCMGTQAKSVPITLRFTSPELRDGFWLNLVLMGLHLSLLLEINFDPQRQNIKYIGDPRFLSECSF